MAACTIVYKNPAWPIYRPCLADLVDLVDRVVQVRDVGAGQANEGWEFEPPSERQCAEVGPEDQREQDWSVMLPEDQAEEAEHKKVETGVLVQEEVVDELRQHFRVTWPIQE